MQVSDTPCSYLFGLYKDCFELIFLRTRVFQEKEEGGRGRFKSHTNAVARISDREKKAPLKT